MSAPDVDIMRDIYSQLHEPLIAERFGEPGMETLRELSRGIKAIYQSIAPEILPGRLVVLSTIDGDVPVMEATEAEEIRDVNSLVQIVHGDVVLQVLRRGHILLWRGELAVPMSEVAGRAIVYEFYAGIEHIYVGEAVQRLLNPYPNSASAFSVPTFNDLREALDMYQAKMVRHSSCLIFAQVWFDEPRLFFRAKPEVVMRRSLTQYLRSRLPGDVEVRPEQNVDESHPVDIKVTWQFTSRLALIEIKWLGKSVNEDGTAIAVQYTPARAREGAKQLADYLDANLAEAPTNSTRGYLVVIDGRRYGATELGCARPSREDGLRFESAEIEYNPDFHEIREDFEVPYRMFAEPLCE